MPSARHKPRALRDPFVVTFAAAVGAVLGGCGGATTNDLVAGADGGPRADAPSGDCPPSAPASGSSCAIEGTSCSYDRCYAPAWESPVTLVCTGGAWTSTGGGSCNPPAPVCPTTEPTYGAPCANVPPTCSYPTTCCGTPTGDAIWSCVAGAWQAQSVSTCNPPAPPPCPTAAPTGGSSCTYVSCGAPPPVCTYGDCYGSPTTTAQCQADGTWSVSMSSCNPPPVDAGPPDAPVEDGGGVPNGGACGASANGAACAPGLACCYPCGMPGCTNTCTAPCDASQPGCFNGCFQYP